MYVCIRNKGIASVESFTLLGLSTARGQADMIGQFGSGVKHSILVCLRMGIKFKIFLGEEDLSFSTEDIEVRGKKYRQVSYTWKGETSKLSMLLEFGELDWNSEWMVVREIVSNAIDQKEWSYEMGVQTPIGVEEETRFYLEMTPDITRIFCTLPLYFLQISGREDLKIIPKSDKSPPRVYRKGVFVTQLDSTNSLLDYNFGDELRIDECRNMPESVANQAIANAISRNGDALRIVFRALKDEREVYETTNLPYSRLTASSFGLRNVINLWESIDGPNIMAVSVEAKNNLLIAKRIDSCVVPDGWYQELRGLGIKTTTSCYTREEQDGIIMVPTSPDTRRLVLKIHDWFVENNLTCKPYPDVRSFTKNMDNGAMILGYYRNNTVYINIEYSTNIATIIEELSHYYTNAGDMTRDLQDFAFRSLACMLEKAL